MSKTPQYDVKVKAIHDSLEPGQVIRDKATGEEWKLDEKEIELCKHFNVPPCSAEPLTRLRRIWAHNNSPVIWYKPHAETGKPLLTFIHPDNEVNVISDREWFERDNARFAMEIDLNNPVFDTVYDLYKTVQFRATGDWGDNVNTIGIGPTKCVDGYMIFSSLAIQRGAYTYSTTFAEEVVDVVASLGGVVDSSSVNHSRNLHGCHWVTECHHCMNSAFLFECRNCEFCFAATNQRNKKCIWFNEQLSEDEWKKRRAEVDLSCYSTFEEYKSKFLELVKEQGIWPENFNIGSEDSTGELLEECVRCEDCYGLQKSTDSYRCWYGLEVNNSAYAVGTGFAQDMWYTTGVYSQNLKFCLRQTRCEHMEYCFDCVGCSNCFGCVGLQKKNYCIFNKQYEKDEYWQRVDEIKCSMLERGEYGEFLPDKINLIGAQFSAANFYDKLSKEELQAWGADTYDATRGMMHTPDRVKDMEPINADDLPDCHIDVPEEDWHKPINDGKFKRVFGLHPTEIAFYKKHKLPIPRSHFLLRLRELGQLSNTPRKEQVDCKECGQTVTTFVNKTFSERNVVCKSCYIKFLETR